MARLPRPLLALLVAVVAFFAVWTLALKPSSSNSSPSAPAPAVHIASHAATKATTAAQAAAHAKTAETAKPAKTAKPATDAHRATSALATLDAALSAHQVVALLFYNPAGADDQADRQSLDGLGSRHGRVVKLAVPVSQLARFSAITNQVAVTTSPTLIVIDGKGRASTLVGFADPLEYNQLISSALGTK